jgi:hypothetical protein
VTFQHHQLPQATFIHEQTRSLPLNLQQHLQLQQQRSQSNNLQQQQQNNQNNILQQQQQNNVFQSDDALLRLEKRQQLLQDQLVALQRERSVLLQRNQRPTRSETLVPAESNVVISRSLPIYLQPPFF